MLGGSLVIHYEQTPGQNCKLCEGRDDIPLTPPPHYFSPCSIWSPYLIVAGVVGSGGIGGNKDNLDEPL